MALPAFAQKSASANEEAKATFVGGKGEQIGKGELVQMPGGVLIKAELRGLPPGEHAFHIHGIGKCETSDQFKSAGDHFAPLGHKHGYASEGGYHAGDMPNQFVGQDGTLRLNVINANVTLGSGKNSLLDQDGSSLVIHAKPDDYKSQPSGDAGDRIACAVIEK
ncbi:superoxide dismutase family protein [Bradyrhizobium icense]|uniref:Superoxide dismutase [Cu-Zn] n=1 Tax=Bradyrhizobium icense TaxID=1274631 RepID=A0A1B1UE01_9BRAD|nr:hypothetical protein LMTR13_12715 [Bradyrhizobium icense]